MGTITLLVLLVLALGLLLLAAFAYAAERIQSRIAHNNLKAERSVNGALRETLDVRLQQLAEMRAEAMEWRTKYLEDRAPRSRKLKRERASESNDDTPPLSVREADALVVEVRDTPRPKKMAPDPVGP